MSSLLSGVKILLLSLSLHPANSNDLCHPPICQTNPSGYAILQQFEGYRAFPYKDTAGIETVGFGHVILRGDSTRFTYPLLPDDAHNLLEDDLHDKELRIQKLIIPSVKLSGNQFSALASFTYNVGPSNLQRSKVLKAVNSNDPQKVPSYLLDWTHDHAGHELTGLRLRRVAEGRLFMQTSE